MSDIDPQKNQPYTIHTGRVILRPTISHAKDGRREYDCVFMQPGRVKQADQTDSNWLIPAEAIKTAAPLFTAISSYLDHPELFGFGWHKRPKVEQLVGITFDPRWSDEENALLGGIRLYDEQPGSPGEFIGILMDRILADKELGLEIPKVGLSAVIFQETAFDEEEGIRVTTAITYAESVDFVYDAGARGYVRAALSAAGYQENHSRVFSLSGALPHTLGGVDMTLQVTPPKGATEEVAPPAPLQTDAMEAIIAQLNALSAQVETLTPEPEPTPQEAEITRLDTLQDAVEQLTALVAAQEEPVTIEGVGDTILHGAQTGLDQVQLAVEAMLSGVRPADGVRPLSGIRELYHLMSGDFEMTGLFQEDRVYLANVDCSTMAKLVADALNKRVVNEFQEYPRWWEKIVTMEDFTNLQDIKWITVGGVGELPTVGEGQAYDEMSWDDLQQVDSFIKKGGYLGLTMEAIDKDDTRKLATAPRVLAQAAWLTLSKSISAIFTANSGVGPNVYYDDSNQRALFHTSNGNLGTTAFSWAAWAATKIAMMKQTEHNSAERLGALTAPFYCCVPIDLDTLALQTLASEGEPGTADNDENPFAEGDVHSARMRAARERVIIIPLWTNTKHWAAVANPKLYPTIGLGFRFGRTPEIFSVSSPTAGLMFTNDTMPIKVRFIYATGPMDYRGLYKHNVA